MNDYQENLSADQIRSQMNYVRNELGGDVEQVVQDAGSLGDIGAYVKAQPIGWMIAAAAAGYLLVPSNRDKSFESSGQVALSTGTSSQANSEKKGSVAGAVFGLATTMATRFITRKITEAGLGLLSGNQNDGPDRTSASTTYAIGNGKDQ